MDVHPTLPPRCPYISHFHMLCLFFSKVSWIISFTLRIFAQNRKQPYAYCKSSGIEHRLVREKGNPGIPLSWDQMLDSILEAAPRTGANALLCHVTGAVLDGRPPYCFQQLCRVGAAFVIQLSHC